MACPAHGTTENLVQFERDTRRSKPEVVTCCWIEDHLRRNGASVAWVQLTANFTRKPAAPPLEWQMPRACLDADDFNPDDAAARIRVAKPNLSEAEANSQAWNQGTRLLQRAIAERLNFAFETTLGGNTIPALLSSALSAGLEVRVWYVGLSSVELHIARVRARVEKGGHPIPKQKIRERFDRSRLNLIRLLPRLTELLVYDNSNEADPDVGERPEPKLLLHMASGKIIGSYDLQLIPEWAKPILAAALKITGMRGPMTPNSG